MRPCIPTAEFLPARLPASDPIASRGTSPLVTPPELDGISPLFFLVLLAEVARARHCEGGSEIGER